MKCIIWNIRGLGNKTSQQQLWYMVNNQHWNIVVLLELLVKLESFYFCKKLKMDKVVSICNNKIWVFSDVNHEVEVLEDREQYLHCKVSSSQFSGPILMTYVYAK